MSPETAPMDPKIDVVFRALFGNERNRDLLLSLLNGLLECTGEAPLSEVTLLSPLNEAEGLDDKRSIMDLACRDAQGRRIGVTSSPATSASSS